jgi:hypothetical protein
MSIIPREAGEAIRLGYSFNHAATESVRLINQHFAGLKIVTIVKDLDRLLLPHISLPATKEITVTDPPPEMKIVFQALDPADKAKSLYVSRIFRYDGAKLIVDHEYLVLPKSSRGQGLGKKVLAAFLEQYQNMDVKEIRVWAGLEDGGAVWAKAGFKAFYRAEMQNILNAAAVSIGGGAGLALAQAQFDAYYGAEPSGNAFPIEDWVNIPGMEPVLKLQTTNWHGWIDLTNTEDLRNFIKYAGSKI